jgi:RNA polymerase sigma-70 factor (ECF subfamily)
MEPLYYRHNGLLFSLAYRMVGSREVAEELVQEAFLTVWQRASSYDPQEGSVRAWLTSLMRYHTIDYLRKVRRRSCCKEVLLEEIEWEEDATSPDVWEDVWQSEQRLQVYEALLQLPVEQRLVIHLAYFQGWTHQEIAERCQLPFGTVKSRLRLGLLHLKPLLEQQDGDELPSSNSTNGTKLKDAPYRPTITVVVRKAEGNCHSGYEMCRNGVWTCFGYTTWEPLVQQIDTFDFLGDDGKFTARKEKRLHGYAYWYAFKRSGKRKEKMYLGRSSELTLARMEAMAKRLGFSFFTQSG